MSNKGKTIDYLFEDPPIPSQKFALISIVGPHMPQKCEVWGLKIRGVADTAEKAKTLAQKIMRVDNTYDVYTVEVGKFFPLAVEPQAIGNVEYQNNQLNELVKTYMENREMANEHWNKRKNEMIKEAVREGKSQEELSNRPEHPIAVLQRIKSFQQSIEKTREDLNALETDLQLATSKFSTYTDEERELANKELESAISNNLEASIPEDKDLNLDDIRAKLMEELNANNDGTESADTQKVDNTLLQLKSYEEELDELQELRTSMDPSKSPNAYNRLVQNIRECEEHISQLKKELQNDQLVNDYINASYSQSSYDYLQTNIGSSSASASTSN